MTELSTKTTAVSSDADGSVWIVGCDDSDNSRSALDWAARVGAGRASLVRAVVAVEHAPSEVPMAVGGDDRSTGDAEVEYGVTAAVTATAGELSAATGTPIEVSTYLGGAARAILEAVDDADADLVVVGCRGRGGFRRLLLGSVSHQVATHSDRPCVIVPATATARGIERVVVGVDGSDTSVNALVWAHHFAGPDAEVCAAGFWEPAATGYEGLDTSTWQALRAASERRFEAGVLQAEHEIGEAGRFVRAFDVGPAAQGLVDLAADRDLLVVGERAHRGLLGMMLGSVANWVIHHLSCPGVVIPAPPESIEE
ncbi:MAG: universal stress protein [Acidimicrobiales bacterium]